jgi:colicin import membrane protein
MKDTGTSTGWSSWSLSILLHVLVVAGLVGAWFWYRAPAPTEQRLAIEASVITSLPVQSEPPAVASEPAPDAEPEPEPDPQPEPVPEPEPRESAAELAAREAEAKRVADAERVAEQRRVAEARLAAQRKTDQAAREKKDRETKEREQKERERVERERVERERAEQLRRQREQTEMEARLQREAELSAKLAAEQRIAAARSGAAGQQYIRQIAAHIERRWNRPPGATPGTQCEVRVTQAESGTVIRVEGVRCNRDETVRQSIEDAVLRASPLPQPSDPALFDRNLTITFRPEN